MSATRLGPYGLGTSEHRLVYSRYLWNVALSEALYPILQSIEIGLRNAIHKAACERFATESWLIDGEFKRLGPRDAQAARDAAGRLASRGKAVTPASMMGELRFGFWTSLLDRYYEQQLWPALLSAAFPGMPRRLRTRAHVSARFQEIRALRNRVFHHEPIWRLDTPALDQRHAEARDALSWVSGELAVLATTVDRFHDVWLAGPTSFEHRLLEFG